jgi:hypothetical protein
MRETLGLLPLLLVVGAACASCNGASSASPDGGAAACIPSDYTFNGYHAWAHAAATPPPGMEGQDGIHAAGPLEVYYNPVPAHGSTAFPPCMVIVKEPLDTTNTSNSFAMVKVGGGYNAGGATNWEWFSILPGPGDTATINWQGPMPINQPYSGTAAGDCNGCHEGASDNDFVWDMALTLSKF